MNEDCDSELPDANGKSFVLVPGEQGTVNGVEIRPRGCGPARFPPVANSLHYFCFWTQASAGKFA
jgi:hypothetical protein